MKLLLLLGCFVVLLNSVEPRDPFVEVSLDGTMSADIALTADCSNQYTTQFRQTLIDELAVVKSHLADPTFCPGITNLGLVAASVNLFANGLTVTVTYAVDLIASSTDSVSAVDSCASTITSFLSDFDNWKQPIWTDIFGCSAFTFTSTAFSDKGKKWICAA